MEKFEPIRSKDNDFFKRIKSYALSKYRRRDNVLLVEGQKTYDEALSSLTLVYTVVSESYLSKNREICVGSGTQDGSVQHEHGLRNLRVLSDALFALLSELKTSQGILGVFEAPVFDLDIATLSRVVVLEGVQDPKNVGVIIRTAHCLSYQAVFLGAGCAHAYSPKVIRASMGSSFHVPTVAGSTVGQIEQLKDSGFLLIGADVSGSEELPEGLLVDQKIALVIGGEGSGLSQEVLMLCDYRFRLKICESAESLNAAVASGIIMYILNADLTVS